VSDQRPPKRWWWRCWLFILSLIVPGLGQALNGEYRRGVFVLIAAVFCSLLVNASGFIWRLSPLSILLLLIVASIAVFVLGVWAGVDAFRRGRQPPEWRLPRLKRYFVYAAFLVFAHVPDALSIAGPSLKAYSVPSESMLPGLVVGDNFFVVKNTGGSHAPVRGDVVVFRLPRDPAVEFIKRVIGLPGDRVQMKDGMLYLNGMALKREQIGNYAAKDFTGRDVRYLQFEEMMPDGRHYRILKLRAAGEMLDNTREFVVPPGRYFMMGDNRDNSADSRDPNSGVGFVPSELLVGKAAFIFASTEKTSVQRPSSWLPVVRWSRIATIVD
jgi:signal peptidase I